MQPQEIVMRKRGGFGTSFALGMCFGVTFGVLMDEMAMGAARQN